MVRLRSRRLRADAARVAWCVAVLTTAACEAVYGVPESAGAGESTGLPGQASGADEGPATTGDRDPDPVDSSGVDGGVGIDLGSDPPDEPPPANLDDCCVAGRGVGCVNDEVEVCVCAVDPVCCESGWDELCANEASELGCASCAGDVGPRTFGGTCCSTHPDPGCLEEDITACVCASDPYCCMVAWDQVCVERIGELGCGDCTGPMDVLDCCTVLDTPGCANAEIQACVCAQDSFCCETQWDELCASEVETFGCGACFDDLQPVDDCCLPSMLPGCDDPGIAECVCGIDVYCCETIWDGLCVGQVDELGCGACSNVTTSGTDDAGTDGGTGVDPTGMEPATSTTDGS